jgi:cellulose 1,4-beta-cellobiosidase
MKRSILLGGMLSVLLTGYACGDATQISSLVDDLDSSTQPLPASKKIVQGNPYNHATQYVDPDYTKLVEGAADRIYKSNDRAIRGLTTSARKMRGVPTGVWLDRIAAINGHDNRHGLQWHLDNAVDYGTKTRRNMIVNIVVYDLPTRDCAALASNGELKGKSGLETYKTKFIDPIYKIISNPKYSRLRLALIIEPDSLPNLVTNTHLPNCAEVARDNLYTDGIGYAIKKLGSLPNTFLYLDIAHSAWLGWENNMSKTIPVYTDVIRKAGDGDLGVVRGFATNTSNYTPLIEPFLVPDQSALFIGQESFYQWNPIIDEVGFVKALSTRFMAAGFKDVGFITDTARNGWPIKADGKPIDRRKVRGNWCNVQGSGIGHRPQTSPSAFVTYDAFVFIKPPGESDGAATPGVPGYDPNCDPSNAKLDAMPGSPRAGHWNDRHFQTLLQFATPAL